MQPRLSNRPRVGLLHRALVSRAGVPPKKGKGELGILRETKMTNVAGGKSERGGKNGGLF